MKKYIYYSIFCFVLLLGFGCKKENLSKENLSKEIVGEWELRRSTGGMLAGKTYAAGNGNIWKFDGEKFEKFQDNKLVGKGNYSLILSDGNNDGENSLLLEGLRTLGLSKKNNELVFYHWFVAADGTAQTYERIK